MTFGSLQHACPTCGAMHNIVQPESARGEPGNRLIDGVNTDRAAVQGYLVIPSDVPADAESLAARMRDLMYRLQARMITAHQLTFTALPIKVIQAAETRFAFNNGSGLGVAERYVQPYPLGPTQFALVYGARHAAPGGHSNGVWAAKEWLTPEDAAALWFTNVPNEVVALHEIGHCWGLGHYAAVIRQGESAYDATIYDVMSREPYVYSQPLESVQFNDWAVTWVLRRNGRLRAA